MSSPLQGIAEALGKRVQRAVAVDDPRMRLQVYSPHYGPVDDTRLESILHREAPPESVKYVLSQGIATAPGPVRIPACPELGLLPRVCAPIRCQRILLGYLWLVDAEESLTDAELAIAAEAAEDAGVVMYREQLLNELERGRERELFRDLLSGEEQVREHAATALVDGEIFLPKSTVAALVVRATHRAGEPPDDHLQIAIGTSLEHGARVLPPRHSMYLSRLDHGTLIASARGSAARRQGLADIGHLVHDDLQKTLGDDWRVIVGIGTPQERLATVRASYNQALHAVRVAEIAPGFDEVVQWSQLGIYGILARVPAHELTAEALHPGLVTLLETDGAEGLLETLECYLDRAGDAKATAAELLIHRTSLYYRLNKIEQIAGVSLNEGGDRLALHLGLKMARLGGIHPKATAAVPTQPRADAIRPAPKKVRSDG
jgi:sugar diacid utilization regulator